MTRPRTTVDDGRPQRRGSAAEEGRALEALREAIVLRVAERGEGQRGLKRLLGLLDGAEGAERRRSAACEAAIGLRLLARGARIQFEVPTASGRTADFLVRTATTTFALHVKRWSPPDERPSATMRVPAAIRRLERVRRPYLVGVRWPGARLLVEPFLLEGTRFLQQASVGDEWVFRDGGDAPAGGLRVLAPWPGDRVVLTVGLDATNEGEEARVQRLLRKAYAQFVVGMPNVIALVGGARSDERLIDTAIAGSHVERWDLFPPRGHRVAHGRGDDGFWSGERYALSRIVAWGTWSAARGLGATRAWFRSKADADPAIREVLR